jgi:hypothetical protein
MVRVLPGPALIAGMLLVAASGCQDANGDKAQTQAPAAAGAPTPAAAEPHAHKPGAHGGLIVVIGRDDYHAEAVFEKGGLLRLYTLGKDETRVLEVESQTLTAFVKAVGGTDSVKLSLESQPQPGDGSGKTSLFVGRIPAELQGRQLDVTVPGIRIGGERFRLGFRSAEDSHGEVPMPAKVADAEEEKLYLTPGGLYTKADIAANGNTTASQKFRGKRTAHDRNPRPGDKLCPITRTKANPAFAWVVGGKAYEFCCPPCIDEFVRLAKEEPASIQPPEFYRQK